MRLADLAHRRRRLFLLITVVFVVLAAPFGGPVATLLSTGGSNFEDPDSESVAAREHLERAGGTNPDVAIIVLVDTRGDVRSTAARSQVEAIAERIERDPVIAQAVTFYDTSDPTFVSRDGSSTYIAVFLRRVSERAADEGVERIQRELEEDPAVRLGGPEVAGEQVGEQVGKDLARAELLAFPILFILALFVFRGVVAALLPLLAGLISIVSTFLGLRAINELTPLSVFALNLVTGLGLGLAIDYSLFIVSRYREEVAHVGYGVEALRRTLATAGRTVAYSSLTVAVALATLLVFPQPFLYSMGIGGVLVALISATTALVVLPAVLAVLGPRVNALALERWRRAAAREAAAERSGMWYRLSQAVMRRAGRVALASAVLLIALGIPFLGIEFTGFDARLLPETASARQVADALEQEFPPSRADPILAAVEAPSGAREQVEAYAARLRGLPGAEAVTPPQPVGQSFWKIELASRDPALAEPSKQLVERIRGLDASFEVWVGGQTAAFLDQQESLGDHLPIALGLLALGTVLILFAMTGSLVLPVKALVMNLLTLSAAFGILVLVFQHGRLEGLLDYDSLGALDATQPILLFAVAFGLTTDYAVFLLTRIKEARDSGLDNTEAVATGLERTGRIVTAAALLFSIAIGAFSTSEIVFIKEVGVGIALAVLIDATIVRALLVPSLMKLLGVWNWWAPGPLRRLHDRLHLGEAELPAPRPTDGR